MSDKKEQLKTIIHQLDVIAAKLDRIENEQQSLNRKLNKHIDFIDETYEGLKNPINAARRWLGR